MEPVKHKVAMVSHLTSKLCFIGPAYIWRRDFRRNLKYHNMLILND